MALEAVLVAALAQSSLLVGGLIVYAHRFASKTIGLLAAFGAGALLSAVSFDLIPEATDPRRGRDLPGCRSVRRGSLWW